MPAAADPAPELGTVLALDNVPVELPLARVGSRVLAGVLDYLLLAVVATAWSVVIFFLARGLGLRPGLSIPALRAPGDAPLGIDGDERLALAPLVVSIHHDVARLAR